MYTVYLPSTRGARATRQPKGHCNPLENSYNKGTVSGDTWRYQKQLEKCRMHNLYRVYELVLDAAVENEQNDVCKNILGSKMIQLYMQLKKPAPYRPHHAPNSHVGSWLHLHAVVFYFL